MSNLNIDKLVTYPLVSNKLIGYLTIPINLTEYDIDRVIKITTAILNSAKRESIKGVSYEKETKEIKENPR